MADQSDLFDAAPVSRPPGRFAPRPQLRSPRPTGRDRLFFGIFPDAGAIGQSATLARELQQHHGLQGKLLLPHRLHATLYHLGDYAGVPQDIVEAASEVAASVRCAPFEVLFDRAMSFHTRGKKLQPLVVLGESGTAVLRDFQHALVQDLKGIGFKVKTAFTPHVTLLYDEHQVPEQPVAPISWTVRDFVLVHSLVGRSQHIHLARWPLQV